MSGQLIIPPAIEPISLVTARAHLRLDASGSPATHPEDDLVSGYITAARELVEGEANIALITQSWELTLDLFPSEIVFPIAPVQSVTQVSYVDSDGDDQVLAADQYVLDNKRRPAWLLPAVNVSWPAVISAANALTIEFVAGYGSAASDVPAKLRHAILLIVGDLYANREPVASTWQTIDRLKAGERMWVPSQ